MAEIQCSRCGYRHYAGMHLNRNGITNLAKTWNGIGSALYCPKCVKEMKKNPENYVRLSNSFEYRVISILEYLDKFYKLEAK